MDPAPTAELAGERGHHVGALGPVVAEQREALALQGEFDEACEVFDTHAEIFNHLGLLAEDVDPASGMLLGNFPHAFSHLGLIDAALHIELALRLKDEGSARAPHSIGSLPPKP